MKTLTLRTKTHRQIIIFQRMREMGVDIDAHPDFVYEQGEYIANMLRFGYDTEAIANELYRRFMD